MYTGNTVTSPKSMAQIASSYFIEKIAKIRDNFETYNTDPLEILDALIPKNKNTGKQHTALNHCLYVLYVTVLQT